MKMKVEMAARLVWDYLNLRHPLTSAEAIIVLGNDDLRIARFAAEIFKQKFAPQIVFSGGLNKFTSNIFARSEAFAFSEVAMIPEAILEENSTNTQENLEFSMKLLSYPKKVILIQKPNMLRRVFATASRLYPETEFLMTSHAILFEEAPHAFLTPEMFLHEITGDLQRIPLYAERGHTIPQEIPVEVWEAFEFLVASGYTGNFA